MSDRITIRQATQADRQRVVRLAELDGGRAPAGDALVAEVDGQLLAAVGVDDGRAIGDPFEPTADLISLLRLRAKAAA